MPRMNVTASAFFDLDGMDVPEQQSATPFVPTSGWWETDTYFGYVRRRVLVVAQVDGKQRGAEWPADKAPAWIPRPPQGWDASIVALDLEALR